MNFAGVADTHIVLWYLFGDARLSKSVKLFIDETAAQGLDIAVSSISMAELVYLVEKGRVPAEAYARVTAALADPGHVFAEAVFSAAIADTMRTVPRSEVPDMPDRIVAATALHFNIPVLSRDRRIRLSSVPTIS